MNAQILIKELLRLYFRPKSTGQRYDRNYQALWLTSHSAECLCTLTDDDKGGVVWADVDTHARGGGSLQIGA